MEIATDAGRELAVCNPPPAAQVPMLRAISHLAHPSGPVAQLAAKSVAMYASGHGALSRCFSVKSQPRYDIPTTQTAVMYEAPDAPLQVRRMRCCPRRRSMRRLLRFKTATSPV
jgi:hypothetical protein